MKGKRPDWRKMSADADKRDEEAHAKIVKAAHDEIEEAECFVLVSFTDIDVPKKRFHHRLLLQMECEDDDAVLAMLMTSLEHLYNAASDIKAFIEEHK